MSEVSVRPAEPGDRDAWVAMRERLWPGELEEHIREAEVFFAGERRNPLEVLVAEVGTQVVGFAELSIREFVDGCATDRVAYLEGWFVEALHRGKGVGRALVEAAEAWGRGQGCREFASDVEPDNQRSLDAHRALGFEETGRAVNLKKDL